LDAKEHSSPRICLTWSDWQPDVLSPSFGTSETADLSLFPDKRILQHNKASSCRTLSVKKILAKDSTMILKQPPCSPDLAPCDSLLFPTRKNHLKMSHFESMGEIQKVTASVLNKLQENKFWRCFGEWKQFWNSCLAAGVKYRVALKSVKLKYSRTNGNV
jgi:hypothetical protein